MSRWRRQLSRRHNRARARAAWVVYHKCHCHCCGHMIPAEQRFCQTCEEAGCNRWPQTSGEMGAAFGVDHPVSFGVIAMPCSGRPSAGDLVISNVRVFDHALSNEERARIWREGPDALDDKKRGA